jgi:hypothetical protein
MEYAKRYYPDTFKDFSQPSFGALMIDSVAYVGDMLSFYVDYQANESFLSTAIEYNNVLRLAKQYGYKFSPSASSSGVLTLFIMIPVKASTTAPDRDFLPVIRRGSKFISNNNNIFTLVEDAAPQLHMLLKLMGKSYPANSQYRILVWALMKSFVA